jgi:hypothetical protein
MPAVPPAAVCSRPSTSQRSVAGMAPSCSSGSRKAQWIAARLPRSRSAAAAEFELGYWARVQDGAERWYVQFEGDISDNEFTVLGHTAADALRTAAREAQSRVP